MGKATEFINDIGVGVSMLASNPKLSFMCITRALIQGNPANSAKEIKPQCFPVQISSADVQTKQNRWLHAIEERRREVISSNCFSRVILSSISSIFTMA
jgi:hypothetical protein